MKLLALVLLPFAWSGCVNPGSVGEKIADSANFEADGVFVRHVRVRLAPSHTKAFEALVERCRVAAEAADLPGAYEWNCYYEPLGRYWLMWFGDTPDGFAVPDSPDALVGFARHVAGAEGTKALAEINARLSGLDYEIEWNVLYRQKSEWSTVKSMSAVTHPKARMTVRTIKPGSEAEFDRALTDRTAFFGEHSYSLPIEGFVTVAGDPGTALQVVFPVDWPSFHATQSFFEFVKTLDAAAQEDYAQRKQALMTTMDRAEFYDGSFKPELSYGMSLGEKN